MNENNTSENKPDYVYLVSMTSPSDRLRRAREEKGLTQTELAKQVHTLYQRIHEWESGWKIPSDKYYSKLAEVLDVDSEWLKEGRMDKAPRFLYDSYAFDKEKLSDQQFKARSYLISTCADFLSWMDYKTLLQFNDLIGTALYADRIVNDSQLQGKEKEFARSNGYQANAERAQNRLREIQNLLNQASEKLKNSSE